MTNSFNFTSLLTISITPFLILVLYISLCAYALAHNEMMGTEISKVVILMVDREGKFAEYTIQGDEFEEYCNKWSDRLADYYAKVS